MRKAVQMMTKERTLQLMGQQVCRPCGEGAGDPGDRARPPWRVGEWCGWRRDSAENRCAGV